jgi:hypothetical protein
LIAWAITTNSLAGKFVFAHRQYQAKKKRRDGTGDEHALSQLSANQIDRATDAAYASFSSQTLSSER